MGEETIMKKTITLALDDADLIELLRILMNKDAEGALAFLQQHVKGKVREALEGS
jgi:DNA polymerase III gamma/tau subunit